MFAQKRNSVNVLKRNLIAILFLSVFMCAGILLSGFAQVEIHQANTRQAPVQVEEFEEDLPELLETVEIVKLPKHYY